MYSTNKTSLRLLGYDHITCAIGGSIAAAAGADFLCYVTASEHLALPTVADVHEGVMASRIAARITSYNVCYTKLLRGKTMQIKVY